MDCWDVTDMLDYTFNINIAKQIDCLYQLFTQDYTHGKKWKITFSFNAIGYLTHDTNFDIPVRTNFKIFVRSM